MPSRSRSNTDSSPSLIPHISPSALLETVSSPTSAALDKKTSPATLSEVQELQSLKQDNDELKRRNAELEKLIEDFNMVSQ